MFPQLVDHWRACGNKLKTLRYLTESGAAALATSSNMQALSYLYEVQTMIAQTKGDKVPLATEEEKARVESLIGQVRRGAQVIQLVGYLKTESACRSRIPTCTKTEILT